MVQSHLFCGCHTTNFDEGLLSMKILLVDDEYLVLEGLHQCVKEVVPHAEVAAFQYSQDAYKYAEDHDIDVAFLDINMPGMNGLELGKKLLQLQPKLNLIYCTAYDEYVAEAFRDVRCNGYITKPADEESVAEELKHLRLPLEEGKRVKIQCFGRFEVYLDKKPMVFESAKTKELLAYLVYCCGGICSNPEIIATLWDDDGRHESYFKKLRKDLLDTLEQYGCSEILWRQRGGIGIDPKQVDCDYYEWKKKNEGKYTGDFMIQYDWANVPLYEW